jgi:hypothetical protein
MTQRMTAWAGLVITATLLVACSGGGGGTADVDYTSGKAIGQELDKQGFACNQLKQDKGTYFVREEWNCNHTAGDDNRLTIDIYASQDQRKQIQDAFSALATGHVVNGNAWDVSGISSKSDAKRIQKILGGTVDN